jgi:hypothetical protein
LSERGLELMRTWIVAFWSSVFRVLGWLSLFALIRLAFKRASSAGGVEVWVTLNAALSVLILYVMSSNLDRDLTALTYFALIYAWARIFEIFVYQVNVLLFDQYRSHSRGDAYAVKGYRRIVLLLLHNYFELVCWFGSIYVFYFRAGALSIGPGQPDPTFFSIFRDSLLLMFSFNAERYSPANDLGLLLFSTHAAVGVFMTVLVFARFLALLPSPDSQDPLEKGSGIATGFSAPATKPVRKRAKRKS